MGALPSLPVPANDGSAATDLNGVEVTSFTVPPSADALSVLDAACYHPLLYSRRGQMVMNRWQAACCAGALAALVWAGPLCAQTPSVSARDDSGRTVTLARPAQRVITLMPSATETICSIGACDRLVATDRYSDWPAQVRALPKAGGYEDPAPELIAALKPDLVVLTRYGQLRDVLDRLGIATAVIDTRTLADVPRVARLLAVWLGSSAGAERFTADWLRAIPTEPAAPSAQETRPPLRVYFEVDRNLYSVSRSTFVGELIARAGGQSIVPDTLGDFPQLSAEFILRADPEVIVLTAHEAGGLRARPGWASISAVRHARICVPPEPLALLLTRPGPRLTEALEFLRACLSKKAGA